ncbi:MAG: mechanosensitive ion channel [Chloroflexi bacterium]|nr:mechanosensitive ion channel [Chloroflexota bacterium]MDA1269823.1 mechanosensitive ion channel [Chloroflexota bacterium]
MTVLAFTARLVADGGPLEFLESYQQYVHAIEVVVFGSLATEFGARWAYYVALSRTSVDVAVPLRVIARIVAYAVILSAVVSLLTSNVAAALTAGSFAGLVAGLATQSVMGNAVAGMFLTLSRPIRIGDNVTIGGNSGRVTNITLMHIVLGIEDREIMIPSSNVVTSVLVRHLT